MNNLEYRLLIGSINLVILGWQITVFLYASMPSFNMAFRLAKYLKAIVNRMTGNLLKIKVPPWFNLIFSYISRLKIFNNTSLRSFNSSIGNILIWLTLKNFNLSHLKSTLHECLKLLLTLLSLYKDFLRYFLFSHRNLQHSPYLT